MYYDGQITADEYWARVRAEVIEQRLRREDSDKLHRKEARKRKRREQQRKLRDYQNAAKMHREMYPERYQRPWWKFWGDDE